MTAHRFRLLASVLLLGATFCQAADKDWVVRPESVGSIKIGMTPQELSATLHETVRVPQNRDQTDCFYVNPHSHPDLKVMILHMRVARIDIPNSHLATAEGVRVGDSEERARQVYGAKLQIEPHKYTFPDGQYLTVLSPQDHLGIRFETFKGKITTYYAGTSEAISLVEGCS